MEKHTEQNIKQKNHKATERKVVLVVDDSPDLLNLARTILELDDFKVFTALNGQEAFSILSGISKPDLILLDMRMREMSGLDFLIALEKRMPELIESVPVVFLTALDEVPSSKAVGFITKPINDIGQFVLTINRFIEAGTGSPNYQH